MARNLVWGFVAVVLSAGSANRLPAQDHVLQELYGRGVHACFSRDYAAAYEQLSAAIDQGSRDPRCFYFRGLALEKTGRPDEASADFRKGAELELTSDEQIYDVSRSLQRVQGPERIKLEESRQVVRVELRKRKLEFEKARYEAFKRAEEQVIRKPPPPFDPGATSPDASPPSAAPPKAPPADDPFGAPAPKPGAKPAKPTDDPFGEATPAKPAAPAKPAPPKPTPEDPFGAEAPAAKPAAPAAKPGAKPAPPKPAADDPFADDAPAAKPAAPTAKPAAPAAKPGEKPAPPKPAADDPFGT